MRIFLIVLVIILTVAVISVIYPIINGRTSGGGEVGNTSLWRSEDGGESWKAISSFDGGEIHVMRWDSVDPNYLLIGTELQGVWRGTRSGENWKQYMMSLGAGSKIFDIVEPASDLEFISLVFYTNRGRIIRQRSDKREELLFTPAERYAFFRGLARENRNYLLVTGSDGGVYESKDAGKSWEVLSRFREGIVHFEPNPAGPSQMWVTDAEGNLFRSDNGGRDWTDLRTGLNGFTGAKNIQALHFDPNSKTLYHASAFGLLESRDLGNSWRIVKTPVPPKLLPITAVATDPSNAKKIYAAAGNQLYVSSDTGVTWTGKRIEAGGTIATILIDPQNTNDIFIGMAGANRFR